jgi:hypothetical protein
VLCCTFHCVNAWTRGFILCTLRWRRPLIAIFIVTPIGLQWRRPLIVIFVVVPFWHQQRRPLIAIFMVALCRMHPKSIVLYFDVIKQESNVPNCTSFCKKEVSYSAICNREDYCGAPPPVLFLGIGGTWCAQVPLHCVERTVHAEVNVCHHWWMSVARCSSYEAPSQR